MCAAFCGIVSVPASSVRSIFLRPDFQFVLFLPVILSLGKCCDNLEQYQKTFRACLEFPHFHFFRVSPGHCEPGVTTSLDTPAQNGYVRGVPDPLGGDFEQALGIIAAQSAITISKNASILL
jgi:hypothetical protein